MPQNRLMSRLSRNNPISGCKSPQKCRLSALQAERRLSVVLGGISATYGCLVEKPKFPRRGYAFWSFVNNWIKSLQTQSVRSFFGEWRPGLRVRRSFFFSLSLLGKSLSDPCDCYLASFNADAFSETLLREDDVSPEYLGFCSEVASRIFKSGWDRAYESFCVSSKVSANGCAERGRRRWGPLGSLGRRGQEEYLDRVMENGAHIDPFGKFERIPTKGKVRPLVKTSESYEYLRPLHKTLYSFLSSMPWLLRGTPTVERLEQLLTQPGKFVSVDFSAASDNLSINVAERILGVALNRATNVPKDLKKEALASLRMKILSGVELLDQSNGQMMGSLLSFPLLCVQTLCFLLYSLDLDIAGMNLRRWDGALVNGDDALLRVQDPEAFFERGSLTPSKINLSKTGVSTTWMNVNSTLFYFSCDKGKFFLAPFVRPARFACSDVLGLGSTAKECVENLRGRMRARALEYLVSESAKVLMKCGRSFCFAGFRGREMTRYCMKYRRFEEICRVQRYENPWPMPECLLQEKEARLPSWYSPPVDVHEKFLAAYNSWRRFRISLPSLKPKDNIERRRQESEWDWRWMEKDMIRRRKKYEKFVPVGASVCEHAGIRFRNKKSRWAYLLKEMREEEKKEGLGPEGFIEILNGKPVSIDRRVLRSVLRCLKVRQVGRSTEVAFAKA